MSKIKLKEIADAIREKDGTTGLIIANDFAARIRAINGSEDLTTELDIQDDLLTNLETEINGLPSGGSGGIIPIGTIDITENGIHNVARYENANVNVEKGIFPEGTIDVTENGEYDVTQYSSVNVSVIPTKVIEIIDPGTYDVTEYGRADVNINVDGADRIAELKGKLKGLADGTITELAAEDFGDITEIRMYLGYYCQKLVNVNIPEGVTTIGHSAFMMCSKLEYVELPSTVTQISNRAFMQSGVSGTLVIRIKATVPPTIKARDSSSGSFRYNGTYTIEVPKGYLDVYKTDTNWNTYDVDNGGPATFVEYEEVSDE